VALGALVFAAASAGQHAAHAHLASLRRPGGGHALPTASPLFRRVACPHYALEVLIYASFAVSTRGRDAGVLALLLWVATNLSVSAHSQLCWYRERFPPGELPPGWCRLVPGLW